jgi:hypothetical protein
MPCVGRRSRHHHRRRRVLRTSLRAVGNFDDSAPRADTRMYVGLDYYHREWRSLGVDVVDFAQGGWLVDALFA